MARRKADTVKPFSPLASLARLLKRPYGEDESRSSGKSSDGPADSSARVFVDVPRTNGSDRRDADDVDPPEAIYPLW